MLIQIEQDHLRIIGRTRVRIASAVADLDTPDAGEIYVQRHVGALLEEGQAIRKVTFQFKIWRVGETSDWYTFP